MEDVGLELLTSGRGEREEERGEERDERDCVIANPSKSEKDSGVGVEVELDRGDGGEREERGEDDREAGRGVSGEGRKWESGEDISSDEEREDNTTPLRRGVENVELG